MIIFTAYHNQKISWRRAFMKSNKGKDTSNKASSTRMTIQRNFYKDIRTFAGESRLFLMVLNSLAELRLEILCGDCPRQIVRISTMLQLQRTSSNPGRSPNRHISSSDLLAFHVSYHGAAILSSGYPSARSHLFSSCVRSCCLYFILSL